jgi:hypothetical protein
MKMNERDIEEMFDTMLDECFADVDVCGHRWSPSVAFKRIDPIGYRVGLADYESELRSEGIIPEEEE